MGIKCWPENTAPWIIDIEHEGCLIEWVYRALFPKCSLVCKRHVKFSTKYVSGCN